MKYRLSLVVFISLFLAAGPSLARLRERYVATQNAERTKHLDRRPSMEVPETVKYLSSAYTAFYNRHDAAGCMHLGQAIVVHHGTDEKSRLIQEQLFEAKRYCIEDRTTRAQAIKSIRDSIRLLNGHTLVSNE